jgi:hypothetical protein
MIRKVLMSAVAVAGLALSASAAEVIIRTAPPRPLVEHRAVAPGQGYVWVGGYHRWDGNAYVWMPGSWMRAPHAHAVWVAPRYEHRHGGYVFVAGHWR